MVFVSAYFQKMNLIALLNLQTNSFQRLINCFANYHSAIFGRTYKVIQQNRDIMRFMYVFASAHTYKDINTPQAAGNLPLRD